MELIRENYRSDPETGLTTSYCDILDNYKYKIVTKDGILISTTIWNSKGQLVTEYRKYNEKKQKRYVYYEGIAPNYDEYGTRWYDDGSLCILVREDETRQAW